MLHTPHQIAIAVHELEEARREVTTSGSRWTWIAGRKYRANRRL